MSERRLIALRSYRATFPSGEEHDVTVGITEPYVDPASEHGDFRCDLVISWPDGTTPVRAGIGVDSLGALHMAMQHWLIEAERMKSLLGERITHFGSTQLI